MLGSMFGSSVMEVLANKRTIQDRIDCFHETVRLVWVLAALSPDAGVSEAMHLAAQKENPGGGADAAGRLRQTWIGCDEGENWYGLAVR